MPSVSSGEFGWVLIIVVVVVIIANYVVSLCVGIKTLRAVPPPPPPEQEYVTRGEFADFKTELMAMVQGLDDRTGQAISAVQKEMALRIDRLDQYLHEANHRQAGGMNAIALKMERLIVLEEMRTRRPRPPEPETPEGGLT